MISGHGNIETAVSAIKSGAYDFIEKPFKADRLVLVAERALEASRLRREVRELKRSAGQPIRSSAARPSSTSCARPSSASRRPMPRPDRRRAGLRQGAAARTLHRARRARRAVHRHQCGDDHARHDGVELFGVEGGEGRSAASARSKRPMAARSIIDEIGDMPRETQNRILRVLVDQNFQRVGGATRVHVDVRIISSTSRDLAS
jgi:two-component system nitrogen regulation response regulator NtrX